MHSHWPGPAWSSQQPHSSHIHFSDSITLQSLRIQLTFVFCHDTVFYVQPVFTTLNGEIVFDLCVAYIIFYISVYVYLYIGVSARLYVYLYGFLFNKNLKAAGYTLKTLARFKFIFVRS